MADFITAYKLTTKTEGFYDNDPDDYGKETFKGISRKYFPNWPGWRLIDSFKHHTGFPNNMLGEKSLEDLVLKFYKETFWDANNLDKVASQTIAEELFDTGVNLGVGKAALFLQMALNTLNKHGNIYSNISEDSSVGNNTLKVLDACIKYRGESYILKVINILQGMHYIKRSREDESQEKFMYGWLERVDFVKK